MKLMVGFVLVTSVLPEASESYMRERSTRNLALGSSGSYLAHSLTGMVFNTAFDHQMAYLFVVFWILKRTVLSNDWAYEPDTKAVCGWTFFVFRGMRVVPLNKTFHS